VRERRDRLPVAAGVPKWLWPVWACGIAGSALTARRPALALSLAAATGATVAFFRDPDRDPASAQVLAPADGVVTAVDRRADGRVRVATYMSLRDVHVNRAPVAGVVRSQEHRPGAHVPAFDKDSERNERLRWTIDTALGEVELVQIAGTLARRIVPYVQPGEPIAQGQRIGLIRFGSRVDVVLPPGIEPAVAVGDRLRAGQSRVAGA
jgi:phosphatidylserine decarboxylase